MFLQVLCQTLVKPRGTLSSLHWDLGLGFGHVLGLPHAALPAVSLVGLFSSQPQASDGPKQVK